MVALKVPTTAGSPDRQGKFQISKAAGPAKQGSTYRCAGQCCKELGGVQLMPNHCWTKTLCQRCWQLACWSVQRCVRWQWMLARHQRLANPSQVIPPSGPGVLHHPPPARGAYLMIVNLHSPLHNLGLLNKYIALMVRRSCTPFLLAHHAWQ